jgi:hypothetical protein
MKKYYVNKHAQSNGDHEVHNQTCPYLPLSQNRQELGTYASCEGAVRRAKETYAKADGCAYCSPACHTR